MYRSLVELIVKSRSLVSLEKKDGTLGQHEPLDDFSLLLSESLQQKFHCIGPCRRGFIPRENILPSYTVLGNPASRADLKVSRLKWTPHSLTDT